MPIAYLIPIFAKLYKGRGLLTDDEESERGRQRLKEFMERMDERREQPVSPPDDEPEPAPPVPWV